MIGAIRRLFKREPVGEPKGEDWKSQGNDFLARGDLAAATRCYRAAVDAAPEDAAARLNLGFVLLEQNQFDEARQWLQAVLHLQPQHHEAHFLLARGARSQGDLPAAAESFARAAACAPDFDLAWLEGGQALLARGEAGRARECFQQLASRRPEDAEAHAHVGLAWETLGGLDEAEASYRRALERDPRHAQARFGLGNVFLLRKEPALAAECYGQVLMLLPDHLPALVNLGQAQLDTRNFAEAERAFRRLVEHQPEDAIALAGLGNSLLGLERAPEALVVYERLLSLHPTHALAHLNRGNALLDLQRDDEALESFQRALQVRPGYRDALVNIGTVLQVQARHAEAIPLHRQALEIDPTCIAAHWNLAVCLMLLGQWEEGWREAEWRSINHEPPVSGQPRWTGAEDPRGKTILVYSEQGLGDTIQFCRYVPLLAARGAKVVFSVQRPLRGLLADLDASVTWVDDPKQAGEHDYQTPLLSLPLALGTTVDTVPRSPAYLRSNADLRARWRERLPRDGRLLVGVAWSGNPSHPDDRKRSLELTAIAGLAMDGVRLVSLQKEVRESDRAALAGAAVSHFGDELADFRDTAALADCMDLVISVDTSVAHVAAALGKPTWLLLPFNPDWRWLMEREDTPWYPSVRIVRQQRQDDWPAVLEIVRQDLRRRVDAPA